MAAVFSILDRFNRKVKAGSIAAHMQTPCLEWQGAKFGSGYGAFWLDGRNKRAHRVAWQLTNGPIPNGLFVLHHCDNRICVNVAHLWLGTHDDNMEDMVLKERSPLGERNFMRRTPRYFVGEKSPTSRLTDKQRGHICNLYSSGNYKQSDLATMFGVDQTTVSVIVRQWKVVA